MEESLKGAVPGSSTKNASLYEDFGKDFLNWKPSKFGKDSMDFDIEPVDGKSKKFNFGKLDDFDLGADFGKLPSFKMDMSDLDFSSPVKIGTKSSNEKSSKESVLAKKGQEKDKFSFTFDFDEFGKFDLDSQVTKEKKNTQAKPTSSSTSSDHNNKSKTQSQNSNMDIDTEKAAPKPDTSKSHNSIENNINVTKQISDNLSNASHSSLKVNKEFSLPSLSGNSSSRRFREVFDKTEKQETSVQSIGSSSHSRSERNNNTAVTSANRDEIKEKDAENINISDQNRNSDGEKSLNNVTLASAVNRDVRHVNSSTPTKEKLSASVLYKSQQTSILTTNKNEGLNLLSSDIRRDSKQLDGQGEISKTVVLTKLEKPSINGASLGTGNSKVETENKTFSTLRSTTSSLLNNKVLLKDEKQIHVSRLVKLNPRSPTVAPEKDLKSAKLSERNKASLSPQIKTAPAPPVPIFSSKEKLVSPSLKRKVAEESASGPFIRNPLKRISSNSPIETRKSPEIVHMSPKMIAENGIPEDCNNNLASPNALTLTEMPVFLENNSNVEKAEKISKDLDDICSLLKKKQEETKELLVQAVVNNNKLLMLNHPMYDEKLRALESFAATLRAKHLIS